MYSGYSTSLSDPPPVPTRQQVIELTRDDLIALDDPSSMNEYDFSANEIDTLFPVVGNSLLAQAVHEELLKDELDRLYMEQLEDELNVDVDNVPNLTLDFQEMGVSNLS